MEQKLKNTLKFWMMDLAMFAAIVIPLKIYARDDLGEVLYTIVFVCVVVGTIPITHVVYKKLYGESYFK